MPVEDHSEKDPIQSLIAEIVEAENRGDVIDHDALIQQHAEHADFLRDFFARHDQMKLAVEVGPPTLPPSEPELVDPTIPLTGPDEDPTVAASRASKKSNVPISDDQVRYFGDYELLEEIARGGMGVVFKARQMNLNRTVALKMILAGQFAGEKDVQRFYTEAEAAAQLDHPGIVPIFEIGEHAGQHYFSMGYIEGESLAQRVADGPLPPREAAGLVKKICDAMANAHDHGVIHRDLKPANILIDQNGQPKVTDFGLAKKTEADSDLTGTGQILGTPAFMPPEQASGKVDEVGPLADVYSLGAVLYCLLTGRPPFQAASAMDTLLQVLNQEPVSPRILNRLVPQDLETICLKCLGKASNQRYRSMVELRDELDRYLMGEPIRARPVTAIERGVKWVKRKPIVAGFFASALLLLLTFSVGGPIVALDQANLRKKADESKTAAERARSLAEEAQQRERRLRQEADQRAEERRQRLYTTAMGLAQREWAAANVERVLELLSAYIPQPGQPDLRGFEWYYLWRLAHSERQTLRGHEQPVRAVAFSPDGATLATNADSGVHLWDVETGRPLGRIQVGMEEVWCLDFAPDGQTLAVGGRMEGHKAKAVVIDMATRQARVTLLDFLSPPCGVLALAFSPDGKSLATGTAAYYGRGAVPSNRLVWVFPGQRMGEVRIWDVESGRQQAELEGPTGSILGLDFSPDGTALAAGCWDQTVRVWDRNNGMLTNTLESHTGYVWSVAFSADGNTLASGSGKWDGVAEIKLWNVPGFQERMTLRGHSTGVTALTFSPDGNSLATASWDRQIKLWDVKSGAEKTTLNGHGSYLCALSYSPDGRLLASGSWDQTAKIWYADQRLDQTTFVSPETGCYSLAFSSDDAKLAFASPDVKVLDTSTGEVVAEYPVSGGQELVAYSADRQLLATASTQGEATVRDAETGELLFTLNGRTGAIWSIAFSPDSRLLATGSRGNSVKLWSMTTGKEEKSLVGSGQTIRSLAFSPNGQLLAGCCHRDDRAAATDVRIWDVASGEVQHVILAGQQGAHTGNVEAVAFSSDGRIMATCGHDQTARLWDTKTWQLRTILKGHLDTIYGLALSPDNRTLATAGWDGAVKLWSTANGQLLTTLGGNVGVVYCVGFSHDGKTLVAGSGHISPGRGSIRQLKFWHAATDKEVTEQFRSFRSDEQSEPLVVHSHSRHVRALDWSDDGKLVVSGDAAGNIVCHDVSDWRVLTRMQAPSAVMSLTLSPDGRTLATSGRDGTVALWSVPGGKREALLKGHTGVVHAATFSSRSDTLITAGEDTRILLWDLSTHRPKKELTGHKNVVSCLTLTRDGKTLVSGSWDRNVKIWDVQTGKERRTLENHRWGVVAVAITADQKRVAAAGGFGDPRILVWDTETGNLASEFSGHVGEIAGLSLTPDGKLLLSVSHDRTIRVWDIDENREVGSLEFAKHAIHAIAMSPSGESFVTADGAGVLRIWNTAHVRETVRPFHGPSLPRIMPVAEQTRDNR